MNCPQCNAPDLEIGESEIAGKEFTAPVFWAACNNTVNDDPNWGGGENCGFFVARETKDAVAEEIERLSPKKHNCPYCKDTKNGKMTMGSTSVTVPCHFCR